MTPAHSQRHPDPRRWVTTLAADVPAGPQGQPSHKAGAEVVVLQVIPVPQVGNVSISVPRTSVLLLNQAGSHLKRAVRLRSKLPGQTRVPRWTQPGIDRYIPNEDLVFDFFEEAMAGIELAHTALDNYAKECIPADFVYTDDGGKRCNVLK